MKKNRGFTLIELLVVIAIIGILTSVVLASLNSARTKGGDTGVKSNLATVRTQAAMYYDANGGYGTTQLTAATNNCTTAGTMFAADTTIKNAIAQAVSNGGPASSCAAAGPTGAAADSWAVSVQLKSLNGTAVQYFCVDSLGTAATTSYATVLGTANTAASAKCQ